MAVKKIEVDTNTLRSDINEIQSSIVTAKKAMDAMMAEIEELNGMWKGKANLAFKQTVRKDHQAMNDMIVQVEKLKSSMEKAAKEYDKCENEVKGVVDAIRI